MGHSCRGERSGLDSAAACEGLFFPPPKMIKMIIDLKLFRLDKKEQVILLSIKTRREKTDT